MAGKNKSGISGGTGRGIQQKVPPRGIKSKVWRRKTPSSHAPHWSGDGGYFQLVCPACRESINVGVKALKSCPRCKAPIDGKGYIAGEIADVESENA